MSLLRIQSIITAACCLFWGIGGQPADAAVTEPSLYHFTLIATTETGIDLLLSQSPEVTEDGQVLFTARLSDGAGALLLGDGGPLTTVTSSRIGISGNALGKQQTNDSGEIVFRGTEGSGTSIFHWTADGGIRILYSSLGSADETFLFDSEPAINNQGNITFSGTGQTLPEAVFVGDRDGTFPTTALAATGGPLFEGFTRFFQPMITDDGTVFVRANKNGSSGIHKLTGPGVSVAIAEVGSGFDIVGRFDVNNQNQVAFLGELSSGERGVFVGDEYGLDMVASENPQFRITNPPGLNDLGNVVFKGEFDPNGNRIDALMMGPDPIADQLISEGEFLFGQEVTQLFAGRGSINNRGQIAFFASRFDPAQGGSISGIFLATPATALISSGANWKYLDDGTNQRSAWRTPGFEDGQWAEGPAQLGYGDNDEATRTNCGPSAPTCRSSNHATTYFRHAFELDDASMIAELSAELLRDDAAAVYLNGVEVFRDDNLSPFAGYSTFATSRGDENGVTIFAINSTLLVDGTNVLAVEVHQESATSSDISFDLSLAATLVPIPEPTTLTLAALALCGCAARWRRRRPTSVARAARSKRRS